jgi:hypothetical protein
MWGRKVCVKVGKACPRLLKKKKAIEQETAAAAAWIEIVGDEKMEGWKVNRSVEKEGEKSEKECASGKEEETHTHTHTQAYTGRDTPKKL